MSELSDRMKTYESVETDRQVESGQPIIIRVDGHGFSKFTKGMEKPFDKNFLFCMEEMVKHVIEKTNADIGYTQSDEATFILKNENNRNTLFGGRIMKLTGIFAATATVGFFKNAVDFWPELCETKTPEFDARVFAVPTRIEAYNTLLARELDATKNAISMLASYHFSHKSLLNLTGEDKKARLIEDVGINFDDLPERIKRGVFVRNTPKEVYLSDDDMLRIPEKNRPINPVMRHAVVSIETPPLLQLKNKEGFLFDKENPIQEENLLTDKKKINIKKNKP